MNKDVNLKKLLIVGLGIAVLVFMSLSIFIQINNYKATRQQIKVEKELIADIEKTLASLKTLESQKDFMLQELEVLEQAIPPLPDQYDALLSIEKAVVYPNNQIFNIAFDDKVIKETYGEMGVKVAYEGYYHGLVEFLKNLRTDSRIFRVNGISISQGSLGLPNIKAEIDISTFYSQLNKQD